MGLGARLLVVFILPGVLADYNITFLDLPVNLTSWKLSLREAFNHSLFRPLRSRVTTVLNNTVAFLRNGSVDCTPDGEECIPGFPSCCPSDIDDDEDLQCLLHGDTYRCGLLSDSNEKAQQRINELQYGGSLGVLDSHPWVNSWEFQSKSQIEREELQAIEEAEWQKHWKPTSHENFWLKNYKKLKAQAKNVWDDLRKMKKLKEVKDNLLDKKKKRLEPTNQPVEEGAPATPRVRPVVYPDQLSEEAAVGGQTPAESEESVIKFSDEEPKREKKVDFRLDDIIKNAVDLATKNLKTKTKQGSKPPLISSTGSEEEPLSLYEIQDTEDKLMKQINELKNLQKQQEQEKKAREEGRKPEDKATGPSIDEIIRQQVKAILEEERTLERLNKLKELKRCEARGIKK